ncbi:MAG: ATP-binding cassette domain-containing protein, partial [Candidatus Oxydemutatoraceae bacterium WSBS_2016_MAG_OTU14]
ESIAIVGASGSGKSTLVSLIPRLYTSSSGGIYIDGQNIKEINLKQLRSQISYAGQFSMSVHDTIADSIRYGQNASLEEIREAARQAYLLDFIESLPDGFDTPVAQNTLSSGQIQRIILARTLLQNLPILIFDEMTSALDQTTEQKIHATLHQTMQGRTCFIISHRFTVIHLVKRIIVMKGGRIVEQGTHDDLLAQQSEYYKLYTQHH